MNDDLAEPVDSDVSNGHSWQDFLSLGMVGQWYVLDEGALNYSKSTYNSSWEVAPRHTVSLPCKSEKCHGLPHDHELSDGSLRFYIGEAIRKHWSLFEYKCTHCKTESHLFAILGIMKLADKYVICMKFGESPGFPNETGKLKSLIPDPDFGYLQNGARCERQGYGIAAFVYYRLAVEGMREKLLTTIRDACDPDDKAVIDKLNAAIAERGFYESLKLARDAIPNYLFLGGTNPLSVLYATLSEGVHYGSTDQRCMDNAKDATILIVRLLKMIHDKRELELGAKQAMNRMIRKQKVSAKATSTSQSATDALVAPSEEDP